MALVPSTSIGSGSSSSGVATGVQNALRPTGSLYETAPRQQVIVGDVSPLSSQRLQLVPIWLPSGLTVTSITFYAGTTNLAAGVHQIFGLFDGTVPLAGGAARALLRGTVDDGATAWNSNTAKTLALTSTYATVADGFYFLGILIQATVPSLLRADLGNALLSGLAPVLGGTSDTGITALPAAAAAPTAVTNLPYAHVN